MKLRVLFSIMCISYSMVASAQSVLLKKLERYTSNISKEYGSINVSRLDELNKLAEKIVAEKMRSGKVTLLFVSENNSSVSQLSQAWFQMSIDKLGMKNIQVNSYGMAEAKISKEAIYSLKQAGFKINANPVFSSNTRYTLSNSWDANPILMFSKKSDNYQIASNNTVIVNVDDSSMNESNALQVCKTIATEMMYLAEKVNNSNLLSHNQ